MDLTGSVTLSRQSGLLREMQVVANNIANAATTGFRQEGLVFAEHVRRMEDAPSVSMAHANVRATSMAQGSLTATGGAFDLAIDGDGFFLIETPAGERLTRAGHFTPNADGDLVTPDGFRVLDAGGAPVFIPPGATGVAVAADGTISAGATLLGQIGVVLPADPLSLRREDGVRFAAQGGHVPADTARVVQGSLEASNVDAVSQLARMVAVQRAYELGQSFLDAEDQRIRSALTALTRPT